MLNTSIIIPVKEINEYIKESIPIILKKIHHFSEIYVLPDVVPLEPIDWGDERVNVVATGTLAPGRKRDVGARLARGEILAFLDDDAYPADGWLGQQWNALLIRPSAPLGGRG